MILADFLEVVAPSVFVNVYSYSDCLDRGYVQDLQENFLFSGLSDYQINKITVSQGPFINVIVSEVIK